ncbi:MAG: dihydrofolate reductase family protein [Massiliimalia sp.]|jgi:riboflavin biosynthesis pyrimidine reductase
MGTSLFKMPFDVENTKVTRIYKSEALNDASLKTIDSQEIRDIYGDDLVFLGAHEDRPYTFTSLVTSIDGKIAFTDAPQGPLIAKLNKYDPDGANADWFILNMLRACADAVILGAGTMAAESDYTCHVFSQNMEDDRVRAGMNPVPWNIISSLDCTDIPFDHILFNSPEVPVMISTSAAGIDHMKANIKNDYVLVGPVNCKEDVTDEMIDAMKNSEGKVIVIATGEKVPDAKTFLYILKKFGMDRVLIETPTYTHILAAQGLMDELFFNYSCIYVGGQALSIGKFGKEFGSTDHPHTRMLSIHTHSDHFFYFRHKLIYG